MSAILHFEDDRRREAFLAMTRTQRADIATQLKPLHGEATLIARRTSPEQERWLAAHVGHYGAFQDDEQLQTF